MIIGRNHIRPLETEHLRDRLGNFYISNLSERDAPGETKGLIGETDVNLDIWYGFYCDTACQLIGSILMINHNKTKIGYFVREEP